MGLQIGLATTNVTTGTGDCGAINDEQIITYSMMCLEAYNVVRALKRNYAGLDQNR